MLFSLFLVTLLGLDPSPQEPIGTIGLSFAEATQAASDGRDAEALAAFQQIASANPDDHEARLSIARLHARMGHQDLAEPVYRSVLLEDPGNIDAMLGVAVALLAREEPAEAINVLEVAEELAPDNDEVLDALGRAHRRAGRTALAVAYFERAVSIASSEQHRLSLEGARRSYLHRVEMRASSEEFGGASPDSRSGDVAVNVRLTDRWRMLGRGQVQRKFGVSDHLGGGGAEWQWKPAITLRGHVLIGPDNLVMPEGDYLGEVHYTYKTAFWTASVRYFDFTGARTTVVSPSVAWMPEGRLSAALRYALTWTEANTLASVETGHSAQIRAAYRVYPRVSVQAGYAGGVEDFENFSIDRIGDFRANTLSGGLRVDLATLTALIGQYERQWRSGTPDMGRVTLALLQSF